MRPQLNASWQREPSRSARRTWTSSPPAWSAPARRTAPATASIPWTTSAVGAVPAVRWPSPPASYRSRSAPTRLVADESRRPSTESSASNPPGAWSVSRGVLPACPSLDCVSIFTLTISLARAVLDVVAASIPRTRGRDVSRAPYPQASRARCAWWVCLQVPSILSPSIGSPGRRRSTTSPAMCVSCPSMSPRCWKRRSCCTRRRSWRSGWPPSAIYSSPTGRISIPSYAGSCSVPGVCGRMSSTLPSTVWRSWPDFRAGHRRGRRGPPSDDALPSDPSSGPVRPDRGQQQAGDLHQHGQSAGPLCRRVPGRATPRRPSVRCPAASTRLCRSTAARPGLDPDR